MSQSQFDVHQPRVYDVATRSQFVQQAVQFITGVALDFVAETGTFRCAVSGGSTPFPVYRQLAQDPNFPLEETELFQVDERFVPIDSQDSNQFQLRQSFGERLQEAKMFTPFAVDGTVEGSVLGYQTVLESLDEPLFDVVVLGIGEDGHVASIFPGSEQSQNIGTQLTCATTAPDQFAGSQRLSLTLAAILSSTHMVVLLSGSRKAGVIKEMIEGKQHVTDFPAKWLLTHPQLTVFQCLNEEE